MSSQEDLFNLRPEKRIQNPNSLHVGFCTLCGSSGEVQTCAYCLQEFCEECGSIKKKLCERCRDFFGTRGRV